MGGRSKRANDALSALAGRLAAASPGHRLALAGQHVAALERQLDAMSHKSILRRGFSLTFDNQGKLLRSAANAAQGDRITTELADGSIRSIVEGLEGLSSAAGKPLAATGEPLAAAGTDASPAARPQVSGPAAVPGKATPTAQPQVPAQPTIPVQPSPAASEPPIAHPLGPNSAPRDRDRERPLPDTERPRKPKRPGRPDDQPRLF
jgi:hypothetical protein